MNLKQAIIQGASNPDLDAALGPIQQALGVTTGDVAGHVFSSVADGDPFNEDYWPHASDDERKMAILKYVETERMYAKQDVEEDGMNITLSPEEAQAVSNAIALVNPNNNDLPMKQYGVLRNLQGKLNDAGIRPAFNEAVVETAFDPYTDPDTKAMLERAGIATHKYRR